MLAIVPARSGSKGLPGKCTRLFNGKPLILHTIEAGLNADCITELIVSTDSKSIYDLAIENGASETFLRPDYLATDTSNAIDTYNYTIERIEASRGRAIEEFVVLLPTAPLRIAQDIDAAYDIFIEKGADSVVSYTESLHPLEWFQFINKDGVLESVCDQLSIDNRQALNCTYVPNGAIYFFKTSLIKQGNYYSKKSYPYVMPRCRSVDIDTIDDFEYAEFLMSKRSR